MKLKTTQMNLDPVKLRGRYERLRNDVDYKDVTITSNDVTITAHKCVLAASSEFFKVLFQRAEMNKRHFNRSTFELGGFTPDEAKYLEPVIDFLYSGTVYMNDINFTGLVKMAEYLMIEELLELGERYINQYASKENYLKLYLDLKKSILNAEGTKEGDMVSSRTSALLKLIWEMVEMNFYDHIIDSHDFFEVLPLEVENLMLENFRIGKVLKLAHRWMKNWPLGYTFADSLINISYDKLADTVDDEGSEELDSAVVKIAQSVTDQVNNRTVPKSNKANMLTKLEKVLEYFGETFGGKKPETTFGDKIENDHIENVEKCDTPLEERSDKMTDSDKDTVVERRDDAHVSVTLESVTPAFDIHNVPGYIETDGVLDLSAKDTSRYTYQSMPKVELARNSSQVVNFRSDSEKEKEIDASYSGTGDVKGMEGTTTTEHIKDLSSGSAFRTMKYHDENNVSTQIVASKPDEHEIQKEQTNVMDNVKSEVNETNVLKEREGSKNDGIKTAPSFEEDQDSCLKMDGTADFEGETEKNETELTADDTEDSDECMKDKDGDVLVDEEDESAMETVEVIEDGDDFTGLMENSHMDDGTVSVKSEDQLEDESLTRMIQDRVSECLNFQDKVVSDLNNSKVVAQRSKISRRRGGPRLGDDDPDYEIPCKRGRRKKSASQHAKKNAKRRIEVINDSATESGVEAAVVKVEVENKPLEAAEDVDDSIYLLAAEKRINVKDMDNEDVFNEFMNTQEDNEDTVDEDSFGSISVRKSKRNSSCKKGRHHECEICHKVYTQKYRLRQHMNMHLGIKPHRCVVCSQMFSRTDHVIRHMRSQHCNMNEFECDVCNEKFEKPNEIVSHYLNHNPVLMENDRPKTVFTDEEKQIISITTLESGKTQYDCKLCEKSFKKPYQAREHVNNHTGERPYRCGQCDAAYAKKDNLSTHIRMVHDGIKGEFQCSKCKRYFFKKENYETHTEKCAPNYKCDKCPMLFYRKTHLDNHMPVHDTTPQVQCPHCDSKFKYRKHLSRHIKKEHSELKPDSGPNECICDQCGVILKSKEALYRHKKVHKVPDKECDVCGKAFKDNTTLKDHKLMHSNIRDYQCEICSMLFSRKGNLVRHQKRHRGERKYRCEVCGMCFVANCDLTRHKNTHLGVKKFPCRFCGRKFGLRSKVTVHERTHTGERPYFCREENCGKTFKQTGDRVRHEKKVHNLVFNKYMTLYELATGETEDIYKRAEGDKPEEMNTSAVEVPSGENTSVESLSTLNPNTMDMDTVYCPQVNTAVPSTTAGVNVPIGNTTATNVHVYATELTNPAAGNSAITNSAAGHSVLKNDSQEVIGSTLETALQLATSSGIHSVSNMAPTDLRLVTQAGTSLDESNIEDIEMSRMFQRTVAQFSSQMMQ